MPDNPRSSPMLEQLNRARGMIFDPLLGDGYLRAAIRLLLDIEIERLKVSAIRGTEDCLLVDCAVERHEPRVGQYPITITHKPSGISRGGTSTYNALTKLSAELKWRADDQASSASH